MASSSDAARGQRGFIPPQNDSERFLMRRVEELCRTAENRGIARSTGFLSDREQALAAAAMNRAQCGCGRFWGGWPGAERRVLCLEPPGAWASEPVAALRIAAKGEPLPGHRDLLGAMLGLGIERVCVGDILPAADEVVLGEAVLFGESVDDAAGAPGRGGGQRERRSDQQYGDEYTQFLQSFLPPEVMIGQV